MNNLPVVSALLNIQMYVDCPCCQNYINLLDKRDTNGVALNGDSNLVQQMFPAKGDNSDFKCDEVTCTECKTTFNVRELEWWG